MILLFGPFPCWLLEVSWLAMDVDRMSLMGFWIGDGVDVYLVWYKIKANDLQRKPGFHKHPR